MNDLQEHTLFYSSDRIKCIRIRVIHAYYVHIYLCTLIVQYIYIMFYVVYRTDIGVACISPIIPCRLFPFMWVEGKLKNFPCSHIYKLLLKKNTGSFSLYSECMHIDIHIVCALRNTYTLKDPKCLGGENNSVSIYTSNKKKFLILFGIWPDNDIFSDEGVRHQHLYIIEFYKTNPFSCFIHTFLDYMKYVCKNVIFFA